MARARTYLVTSTLEPSVDWVLWLDVDIAEFSPSLFEELLYYGNAGNDLSPPSDAADWNDVIIPNAMRRLPDGQLLGFDMNNWAETEESLALKAKLPEDDLLIEGNIWQHMHRTHLADMYTPYNASIAPELFSLPFSLQSGNGASHLPGDQRFNASSEAYIGRLEPLDGIGGVAALVRAEVHRMGAIFPSWIFDHQLETEAFGVLAKKLGANVVGLPNLFVLHCESTAAQLFHSAPMNLTFPFISRQLGSLAHLGYTHLHEVLSVL